MWQSKARDKAARVMLVITPPVGGDRTVSALHHTGDIITPRVITPPCYHTPCRWGSVSALRHTGDIITSHYYERSELLIDGDGEKVRKKKYAKKSTQKKYEKKRAPSPSSLEILPASDSELRLRRSSSGVRLACRDPSGERQRARSTPQQWGPPSLHRSFRRTTARSVHAAVGSV